MITKQCQFVGKDRDGIYFHLLRPGYRNNHIVKTASVKQEVMSEIDYVMRGVPKGPDVLYALVSALGASEYWAQNSNGDIFPESALIHSPPGWDDLPLSERPRVGRNWEWGYPTFYNAHAFAHHKNKDPERSFGDIVHAMWDPSMKRVLLIVAFRRGKAEQEGSVAVLDKIENGEFPDVSMGAKVPFDLCSRCCDWDRISGNPKVDLNNHRKRPIRGLSESTKDYCDHLKNELGRVYSDGVKVGMVNLHPRFFDLSVVFIGADKTSKVMSKLAGRCPIRQSAPLCGDCKDCDISSAHVYDVWSREEKKTMSKVATRNEEMLKEAFDPGVYSSPKEDRELNKYFRRWKQKRGEIEKQVKSNFAPMLRHIDESEEDLPEDVLDEISCDPANGLRTAGALGIVLKPKEFQRTMLISIGKKPLAKRLDRRGICFDPGASPERIVEMGGKAHLIPSLLEKLIPMISERSAFGPTFHKRIVITVTGNRGGSRSRGECGQVGHPLLAKLSSAYTDYRRQMLYKVASDVKRLVDERPQVLGEFFPEALELSFSSGLAKTGGDVMESLIGMMPNMYLNGAYLDEPVSKYIDGDPSIDRTVAAGVLATHGRVT